MTRQFLVEAALCGLLAAVTAGCARGQGRAGTAAGASAAEEGREAVMREVRSGPWTPGLSSGEMETLFRIASDTLDWCVAGEPGAFTFEPYALTPVLKQPMATFVTLKIGGRLRGCIGSLEPAAPLYRSVHDNAVNAAMRDPRFRPVSPPERPRLEVHLSILSPIRPIAGPAEFTPGEHGIIIEKGFHRAVYLPEVAVEQGWTREETLASLSVKAGLPPDGWREGAAFKVFSSVVLERP